MADVKGVGNGGIQPPLNQNQIPEGELPNVQQTNAQANQVNLPVGKPGEGQQANLLPQSPGEKILPDVVAGRDSSQLTAAEQMSSTAGVSATDKLLGLHLQPTITGAFPPPPGNSEALRHLTPAMRRTIVRNLLSKQRERTKRLARVVRRHRDERDGEQSQSDAESSFFAMLTDGMELSEDQVNRATEELVAMARMLDLLDEMLVLQDYTISQMGTFAQG